MRARAPARIPSVGVEQASGGHQGGKSGPAELDRSIVAEVLASVAYGELCGARRSEESVKLAPDGRTRTEQRAVADRELQNYQLIEARLKELGDEQLMELFRPYFDAFFQHTEPKDWVEAQTFHYVGDALVSDFADVLVPLLDRVSAEVVRRALGDREDLEEFALNELTRAIEDDPRVSPRIRAYTQRILGEAFTQTGRALVETQGLRTLLGGEEAGKRFLLSLLDRHRQRLDRLGIDPVDTD
jgi:tRNA-(MS[2]IO[6]A)-hydroxylase (MiaE)-like